MAQHILPGRRCHQPHLKGVEMKIKLQQEEDTNKCCSQTATYNDAEDIKESYIKASARSFYFFQDLKFNLGF